MNMAYIASNSHDKLISVDFSSDQTGTTDPGSLAETYCQTCLLARRDSIGATRMQRLTVATVYSRLLLGGDSSQLLAYLPARNKARFDHFVVRCMSSPPELEELSGPVWRRFQELDVETVDLGILAPHLSWQKMGRAGRVGSQLRLFALLIVKTAQVLRQRKVDIVEGRGDMGTAVAALAGRLAGVRAVVSTNWLPHARRSHNPAWSVVGRGIYVLVDAVISDSVACLDAMRRWMIFPPPGYHVPNGIEPPHPLRARLDLEREFGIPAGATVVAQIARLHPEKGQALLLKAAPTVLRHYPQAFFLVVGYTDYTRQGLDYRKHLEEIVATQGIGHRVRILSYPGNIGDIWALVDIHAHPTLLDSSPIALLEGMSLAKPAVTSRVGGIPELVADGVSGIVVAPGDIQMLANGILRLLKHPQEASRLAYNAWSRYTIEHTPAAMAERIEEVFEQAYARRLAGREA